MASNTDKSILMSQKQVAEYLGTTVGSLNTWRSQGRNPIPFIRWGNRIRFVKSDVEEWIEKSKIGKGE